MIHMDRVVVIGCKYVLLLCKYQSKRELTSKEHSELFFVVFTRVLNIKYSLLRMKCGSLNNELHNIPESLCSYRCEYCNHYFLHCLLCAVEH